MPQQYRIVPGMWCVKHIYPSDPNMGTVRKLIFNTKCPNILVHSGGTTNCIFFFRSDGEGSTLKIMLHIVGWQA